MANEASIVAALEMIEANVADIPFGLPAIQKELEKTNGLLEQILRVLKNPPR
jgi:hypothetical protein